MDTNKNKTHNALDTNTNGDEMNIKLKTHAYQLQILLPLFVNHQQRGKNKIDMNSSPPKYMKQRINKLLQGVKPKMIPIKKCVKEVHYDINRK